MGSCDLQEPSTKGWWTETRQRRYHNPLHSGLTGLPVKGKGKRKENDNLSYERHAPLPNADHNACLYFAGAVMLLLI